MDSIFNTFLLLGKTTIVCPLLTLMLADGDNLILQVVPPALLELSRSVMRSTFSSIMHKRVYSLQFDRSSVIDARLSKKLLTAKITKGVVITTPTAVKSIMLKYMELICESLNTDSASLKRKADIVRDYEVRHEVTRDDMCYHQI